MKERMDELIDYINKASYEYYVLDNPTITDQEYDDYYNELLSIEEKYPELKREDSPTIRVGGEALSKFEKVEHKTPMLSFDDIFNEDEIIAFDERIRKSINNPTYTVEPKMDGLSGSLIYEKGLLVRVATRGNGLVGENITANGKTIKSIPLRLKKDIDRIPAKVGPAYIAQKVDIPMVPVYITKNAKLFSKVEVIFGKPIFPPKERAKLQEFSDKFMDEVYNLPNTIKNDNPS